eukprot:scpid107554/ scgid28872/ 
MDEETIRVLEQALGSAEEEVQCDETVLQSSISPNALQSRSSKRERKQKARANALTAAEKKVIVDKLDGAFGDIFFYQVCSIVQSGKHTLQFPARMASFKAHKEVWKSMASNNGV